MFCYLYVMFDGTNIPLYEEERCFDKCKFFKDGNCTIAEKNKEKLTKDKYGWIMQTVVNFKDVPFESKSGSTRYLSAISMMHPDSLDIWIVKCERLNKDTNEWYQVYRLHRGSSECTEFDDLPSMNRWMRKSKKYDGRKISEDDFLLSESKIQIEPVA